MLSEIYLQVQVYSWLRTLTLKLSFFTDMTRARLHVRWTFSKSGN